MKPESYAVLDQVYDVLNKYPDFKLSIIGHTDDIGTEERNLSIYLLNERKPCYDYLSKKGIQTSQNGLWWLRRIPPNLQRIQLKTEEH